MRRPRLFWRIFATYLLVVVLCTGVVGFYAIRAVRAAVPLARATGALHGLYLPITLSAVLAAAVAALLGLYASRRISRPMRDISEGAARLAAGDFDRRLPVPTTQEFASVATSLNDMAEALRGEIRVLTRERNERDAVLASMAEGVVAVDDRENVIAMNRAAMSLLGVRDEEVVGRGFKEVVSERDLQEVITRTLSDGSPAVAEVVVRIGFEDRFLQANGALLHGGADEAEIVGAVVVLSDVTRLKRLEAVRRDFVANVSHELKTPVTSIKGFAETLLDGGLDDEQAARRFLNIIAGQADRLHAIIEDLLALSDLEAGEREVALEEADLCDVLSVAVDVCAAKAERKDIPLSLSCGSSVWARINPPLLEQAVLNLIDNAIKYSNEGSPVMVRLEQLPRELVISVRDRGQGIPRDHLPRLFERFYRVDKARSRDMGGTGLGLSIVKHIAQVHGGDVSVESVVGEGSVFRIHLPRA